MAERFDKDLESTPPADDHDYPVMPLRNTVLFPQQGIPIYIGREKSLKLIEEIFLEQKKRIHKALKNSDSDSVIKFKNVLKKIINE